MKHIITAVGNRELNDILRKYNGIKIKCSDIQYQEGIIETLEKYKDIDVVILSDEIIGKLSLEELIINIVMTKKDIEIILITDKYFDLKRNTNIIKIVNDKYNYVNFIIKYLITKDYINKEHETINEIKIVENRVKNEIYKNIRKGESINKKNVITIIGEHRVRKNKFYFNII